MKRTPFKAKPGRVWNKTGKRPKRMNPIGKGGRRSLASNAENKKRFEREGIDSCQLCGRTTRLSNSHTRKEDRRDEHAKTALLCTEPCHQFLETRCTADERAEVNLFLIETGLEGRARFDAAMGMLPPAKGEWLLGRLAECA